jgi:hypothetical protein
MRGVLLKALPCVILGVLILFFGFDERCIASYCVIPSELFA